MFNYFRKELDWGGRKLVLETGKIARQADGAVLISYGETIVLCTAVGVRTAKPGQDFFPLTVNYQEKTFAAGKIPGGFFKREGRPTEKEVLTSRLIDRPIRPLFADGWRCDTQVIVTVLSHDLENDPDILAMIGFGTAAGTRTPYQPRRSRRGKPSSTKHGTSGSTGDRVLPMTASGRSLPDAINGAPLATDMKVESRCPATVSVIEGASPR